MHFSLHRTDISYFQYNRYGTTIVSFKIGRNNIDPSLKLLEF